MGKDWDKLDKPNQKRWEGKRRDSRFQQTGTCYLGAKPPSFSSKPNLQCAKCGHYKFSGTPCECENPEWLPRKNEQMEYMQLWHTQWLTQAYRVLKPGGSMLVMGGTRTFHRLACAIEDTGFIIKDTLAWNYGSGFPKAQALSTGLTDKFLQASLQGAFYWKNKTLNSQSDYQEGCHLCGEQLHSSLAVFLNTDLIKGDVPEHNHLSLREFSIHQGNGYKYKASVSSVFFPLAMQDFSPLSFALPKDAFAQVSKLNEIVPILIDDNLPSSKFLLDILYDKHDDIYLNSNDICGESEVSNCESKKAFHNNHNGFFVFHNKNESNNDFSESMPMSKGVQKSLDKYHIEYVQKGHPSYSSFCEMSPVAYIHFSKSCKNCQARVYQALMDYEGYKVGGLKPAWEPILYAVKPPEGSYVDNVLKWGVGAVNVAETRIGLNNYDLEEYIPKRIGCKDGINHIEKLSDKHDSSVNSFGAKGFERQHMNPTGRFPANVILSHHPECEQIGVRKCICSHCGGEVTITCTTSSEEHPFCPIPDKNQYCSRCRKIQETKYKTVESWDCHPDCAVRMLDEQSGISGNNWRRSKSAKPETLKNQNIFAISGGACHSDNGGASRFFYCAKASRTERNLGLGDLMLNGKKENAVKDKKSECKAGNICGGWKEQIIKNNHPTVKPIALFEWLVKLVTREGQIVLDPFIGSGTTAIACHKAGRKCIGIEKEAEYLEIAKRRIAYWQSQPKQMELRPNNSKGRFPANVILDKQSAEILDKQSGSTSPSFRFGNRRAKNKATVPIAGDYDRKGHGYFDSGGASRFFKVIDENIDGEK